MEGVASDLQRQLRRHRATAIAVLLAVLFLAGISPRNQRALFATLPFGNPEALAAIVVPPPSNILYPGRGGRGSFLGGLGIPEPRSPGIGGPLVDEPVLPGLVAPEAPLPIISPAAPPQLASGSDLPGLLPGGAPGLPGFPGGVPGGSAGGPGTPGGGDPGVPGGGGGGGNPGGGDDGPTTPVPEPTTWLMLIGGVLLTGGMLRRATVARLSRQHT